MKIEVLYLRNCPHYPPTMQRLRTMLSEEGLTAEISEIEVSDASTARSLKFLGSPTVRINGLDLDPDGAGSDAGLACRWYAEGLPSSDRIRAALRCARSAE